MRRKGKHLQVINVPFINERVKLGNESSDFCTNKDDWTRLLTTRRDQFVQVVHHSWKELKERKKKKWELINILYIMHDVIMLIALY